MESALSRRNWPVLVLATTNSEKVREIKAKRVWALRATFAELEEGDKNRLSHRGRALALVRGMLTHE